MRIDEWLEIDPSDQNIRTLRSSTTIMPIGSIHVYYYLDQCESHESTAVDGGGEKQHS